jgi:hypothetical protein
VQVALLGYWHQRWHVPLAHAKPAWHCVSSAHAEPCDPVPTGAVQSVNVRIMPAASPNKSQAIPVGQPVWFTALHGCVQSVRPGIVPPVPSSSVIRQSPPPHSPSFAQMRVQTCAGTVALLEKFTHALPLAQSEFDEHPVPAVPAPAIAQPRVVPNG